ncbi:ATP-binding protein [Microvirga yunnanensis]|uniref:ATP-binding protein n=1 Tax=Microvirga yunnanensis TaxID=2953740 RepID=UPI0021C8329A|nr:MULTISPECIES: winged helix-turn-helix domain-containing protein [unclassified Microvirga]
MPSVDEDCFAFSRFRLLPRERTLTFDADPVPVGSRGFEILRTLVSRAGSVVSTGELMEAAWPNITVGEANLRVQIAALRKVLARCETAGRAIETVPLRGYCFVLPALVEPRPMPPSRAFSQAIPAVIGRHDVMADVAQALGERRLVTITGPAGIGKTTVGVATASALAGSYEGRTAYVDFSDVGCRAGIVDKMVAALDVGSHDGTVADLVAALRAGPHLLLLDTCEHLVEHVASLAEELLAMCPDLCLLVCSREILRATGERTFRLPSLSFPEVEDDLSSRNATDYTAISLFIERMGSLPSNLGGQDLTAIAEICRRLDGIPLALEFAAARVPDLGLTEIASRLDDGFSILTRGKRTALPRHRTLYAALEWSFGLLTSSERALLKAIATLPRTFSAAEAVEIGTLAGCRDVHQALSGLFEKSLVNVDARHNALRYRLPDITRAFVKAHRSAAESGC